MQSICRDDVPDFLNSGELFAALDPDDAGAFDVPSDCFKSDLNIHSEDDLLLLLRSLRFWQVQNIPFEALSFILLHGHTDLAAEFPSFASTLEKMKQIKEATPHERIVTALQMHQGLQMMCFLLEKTDCELNAACCSAAAQANDRASLAYLHEHGCPWDQHTLVNALQSGSIDCLQYAQTHDCPELSFGVKATHVAAMEGQIAMLQYLRNQGEPWDDVTMMYAITFNQMACVKYLHEAGCPWSFDSCFRAVSNDRLDCLQYAHEHGAAWDMIVTLSAAKLGHLSCLQYAHKHGCVCGDLVIYNAALYNQLDCLRYLHEHGCPWHARTCNVAFIAGNWRCLRYAMQHGASCRRLLEILLAGVMWVVEAALLLHAIVFPGPDSRMVIKATVCFCFIMAHFIISNLVQHMGQELALHLSFAHQQRLLTVTFVGLPLGLCAAFFGAADRLADRLEQPQV